MLRFVSLLVRNFGPFKDFQKVDFPPEPGVVIVVGANMRGKTSFLNAIRFALFGSTLNRAGKSYRLLDLINDEAKAAGEYEMRVVLEFVFQQSVYKITRIVNPVRSIPPASDSDLKSEMHLERDGVPLSQSESARELLRILPPSLARFFLFDGELLQQYEELLSQSDSVVRGEIVEAIEKILAVPVLLNARRHIEKLSQMAQRDLDVALSREEKHQKLARESTQLRLKIETLERDIRQGQTLLQGLNARSREIDGQLKENADLIDSLRERDRLKVDEARIKGEIGRERKRLGDALVNAWRDVCAPQIARRSRQLEEKKEQLLKEVGGLQQIQGRAGTLRRALESSICPTCGRPMQPREQRADLERELASLQVDPLKIEGLNQEIAAIGQKLRVLQRFRGASDLRVALDAQKSVNGYTVDLADVTRKLVRVGAQIEGRDGDGSQVTDLQRDLQQVNEARGVEKKNQDDMVRDLEEARAELQRLTGKIPASGQSSQIETARAKLSATSQIFQLFECSVDVFRGALRTQVEKRSTDMFLALTSEPDYEGLEINENYGLRILRRSGGAVTIRSAGAEHIVALSLISALQSSSPRPGPVFIDSPFGRLDEVHSKNVVRALPKFSSQVVLLVHENELDLDMARTLLDGALLRELELRRRTSSFTEIVEA